METGKPGLASAAVHMSSIAAQTERRMEVQAPLTALYIHTVPTLHSQPLPQPSLAAVDPTALHLTMPPLYSKETLPFLTLHIANGLQPGLSVAASPPAAKPKSSGKHLCPHCGRDCMKPSVLEKHLRCHTGERPYPCTVCGVSFKTQSNLYKHKRTQAHARLSSESEQSTMSSLDSISWSTETATLSVDERSDESVGVDRDVSLPVAAKTPLVTPILDSNEKVLSPKAQENLKLAEPDKKTNTQLPPPNNRHMVLQRQEATLFSKQWESSVSKSKSQSHESTDSGFSESSEIYHSPGSLLLDHSMDSLTETTEHVEDPTHQLENLEAKVSTKKQESRSLEERITKLISQNSAVVEDKHLENVRPRKTVLSKQGSIDLPMPYTYKDSFHFDMRISKMSNSNKKPGLYSSVPTQQSTTVEHAPLIRSNSLPFSVSLLQPDQNANTSSSHHKDYTTLFRRGSSGQINPTGFSSKSVNQQSSTHRPLVRQAAVDCNHATDALFKNSSVEEACTSSPRCHGEAGDICTETGNRKFRRKKAQKFAYNKWYMYGGGTFKKLYDMERAGENSDVKVTKSMPSAEVIQSLQKRLGATGHCETKVVSSPNLVRSATVHSPEALSARLQLLPGLSLNQPSHILASPTTQRLPLRRNLSLSVLPLSFLSLTPNRTLDPSKRIETSTISDKLSSSTSQSHVNIPSDRKKQRTDDEPCLDNMDTDPDLSVPHTCTNGPQLSQNRSICANMSMFPTNVVSVTAPLGSSSSNATVPAVVRSSFMPKYQLKLPNTLEANSISSGQVEKTTHKDIVSTSALALTSQPSSKCIASNVTEQNVCAPKPYSSTAQLLPCATNQIKVISPVVHQCPVADTKTTASLRNSHVGHFGSILQSSTFGTVAPITQVSNTSVTFTPIHRTQSSPATLTAFTPTQQHLPSNKTCPSPLTPQSHSDAKVPTTPCPIVPGHQTAPKVFHVQTADLQICFQIISDEQLALIEPQIEKQTESSHSQTVQVPASVNEVRVCTALESTDKELSHSHCASNEEVSAINQGSVKRPVCDESVTEEPNANVCVSQAAGQCVALSKHPHSSCPADMVAKCSGSAAVEVEDTNIEKTQKDLAQSCHVSLEQSPSAVEKSTLVSDSHEHKPSATNVNCHVKTPDCPRSDGRTDCAETCTKLDNEGDVCAGNSDKSAFGSNLQLSMVSLSLTQLDSASEKKGPGDGPKLPPAADSEHTTSTASVSVKTPTPAASATEPDHPTGSPAGGPPVEGAALQADTGARQAQRGQSQEPLGACGEWLTTHMNRDDTAGEASDRADSFLNSWSSGQQRLLHLSQTRSGMCGCPPQASGTDPIPQSESDPRPSLLLNTNPKTPQHADGDTQTSQVIPDKQPLSESLADAEAGRQDAAGLFPKQDQRPICRTETTTSTASHVPAEFASQSHNSKKTSTYQSNSSVFMNPPRQTSAMFSQHMYQEEPAESCDKFPPLFGVGGFSYSPADPLSGAVRVVQSSVDAEDSSSDDEGKLIIEL